MEVLSFLLVGACRHCHRDVTTAGALVAVESTRLLLIPVRSCLFFQLLRVPPRGYSGAGAGEPLRDAMCWAPTLPGAVLGTQWVLVPQSS